MIVKCDKFGLNTTSRQQGFTLIELMIVIAIIGILASIAVPQYLLFTNRSFVASNALSAARPFQLAVNEHYLVKQALPTGIDDLILGSQIGNTDHVQSVGVAVDGSSKLTVLFKGAVDGVPANMQGLTLVLQPNVDPLAGGVSWSVDVASSTLPDEFLPVF